MNPVRVLVANQPRLMRELILATICEYPDLEIVGEIQQESEIETAVERTHPDFLIVDVNEVDQLPENCRRLLSKYPSMKIIAVPPGRNAAIYYWAALEFHWKSVESSENSLLSLLRGQVPVNEE